MNDEITAIPEAEKASRFGNLFGAMTQDLWLKAVALALALAFWG